MSGFFAAAQISNRFFISVVNFDGLCWLTYGVVHGDVSLQSNSNSHEDGRAHGDALQGVEEVGEDDDVELVVDVEAATKALQHWPEQVPRVYTQQADQQKVECVAHVVPARVDLM